MVEVKKIEKRVVLVYWKNKQNNPFEVFSNLKNLCLSYPQYNYNTLNNYLSKDKIAYENDQVRIERKMIHSRPLISLPPTTRSILPVVVKKQLKDIDEKQHDLEYWLKQPVEDRLSAITFIVMQSLKKGQRMDKSIINKKNLHA